MTKFIKMKVVLFCMLTTLYLFWVVLEQGWLKEPLFELSVKHSKYFRHHFATFKPLELFFTLVSHLGDKAGVMIWSGISFHCNNTAHAFITNCQICVFVLISQTVKSIIREPRPMFVDIGVKVADCSHLEFGNPSSHTYGVAFTVPVLIWLLTRHYSLRLGAKPPLALKAGAAGIVAVLFLVLGFSRVFKGVHTYN